MNSILISPELLSLLLLLATLLGLLGTIGAVWLINLMCELIEKAEDRGRLLGPHTERSRRGFAE